MPALEKEPILTDYIRSLRGCSRPILARASDGELYVVKFANEELGANLLFNESMGTELYRAFKLPVPVWKPLRVSESFLERIPDFQGANGAPATGAGICFGSRFDSGDEGTRLLEVLPGSSFKRVRNLNDFWLAWLLDICSGHVDNRQAIFRQDALGALAAVFIDHGHMFGGPKGQKMPSFQASRYLDGRIYPRLSSELIKRLQKTAANLDPDRLWMQMRGLPDEWKTDSAVTRLADCLHTFSEQRLIENAIGAMSASMHRVNGYRLDDEQGRRKPVHTLLCAGVQVA